MNIYDDIKTHFKSYGFQWQDSVPILSKNPNLLFNISGGVVFENAISFGDYEGEKKVVSVQTCLRTDGWKKIGSSGRHHLAFDMLGHFSLYEQNEYKTKELIIESAWFYLVKQLGIEPGTLSATVHTLDTTTKSIWGALNVPIVLNETNVTHTPSRNRCGFRTEIVWENPATKKRMELWNLVFTEFEGDFLLKCPLPTIAADSGASIDRIITALECCDSNYENSLWKEIVSSIIARMAKEDRLTAARLADLGKASVLLISQGLNPGNKAAEYVLRKIIREMYLICTLENITLNSVINLCEEKWSNTRSISLVVNEEIEKFRVGLERGKREYLKIISKSPNLLSQKEKEYLITTLGFPEVLIELEESKRKTEVL